MHTYTFFPSPLVERRHRRHLASLGSLGRVLRQKAVRKGGMLPPTHAPHARDHELLGFSRHTVHGLLSGTEARVIVCKVQVRSAEQVGGGCGVGRPDDLPMIAGKPSRRLGKVAFALHGSHTQRR